ncbi:DUF433 domain-containing protein [Spirosoma utsteinense]|uniref:DUF433 domain-containing protein n=1 Tax=Spirosoma utsteinense TaxID=2585773 RepID=A0ABR6W2D4_9BACT|nr:DUF433 domain-containing protein [Spirosoma utsteinense]MBC3785118.1 putative protein (DUF433 family) [Spirosoma utsteinense]MBC3790271.1 putative protein (DUF433 family) [Spirosoma utsteinense]
MVYQHIASTPGILGGKPCIKGTRISVELILETVADGASVADIVREFPQLSTDAVQEAIRYAINTLRSERIIDVDLAA